MFSPRLALPPLLLAALATACSSPSGSSQTDPAHPDVILEGDNLELMRAQGDAIATLIYADPPFNNGRAQTSREIAGLNELPEAARPAFHGIARAVERSRFAGGTIDAAEFARCRKDYESFAFASTWKVAA